MRESVIYQEWREEIWEEARQELLPIAEQRGRQEEARSLLLRQLAQKVGALPDRTSEQIITLSLEQLESLAVALLNFSGLTDLEHWLTESDRHPLK